MTDFVFDDYARTTLGGARAGGKPLTPDQLQQVIDYLKSPGSGPDGSSSYADYVSRKMHAHPPKLGPGVDYVGFSGNDASGTSNFKNAVKYSADVHGKAGIIGDTPWGAFVESAQTDPEFGAVEGKFKTFMKSHGIEPFKADYQGALKDMMWNAGSPEYFENAIARGKPIVAFVENAPAGRGFSNFELTTALKHPDAVINGYPVSAFGSDPLAFASKSAAEFQQLEKTIAQAASHSSGAPVSVEQVRSNLKLIEGYDAVNKTLFNKPVDAFKALSFDDMAATRTAWIAARGGTPGVHTAPVADAPDRVPRTPVEPGAPRGPPVAAAEPPPLPGAKGAAGAAEGAAEAMMPKGLSPSGKLMLKGAGAAGIALMAYDFASTGNKVIELRSQGNVTGAESAATHFVGRSAGGIAGGFLAGAGYGLLVGSETGPGAIVTGLVGGVVGAYAGEKWAESRDNKKIYEQTDVNGNVWKRDPADASGSWTRNAQTEQVRATPAGPNTDVGATARKDSDGDPLYRSTGYTAAGHLARQLNYQSANASYDLGLANPAEPRNPYSIPGKEDRPGYVAGNWTRDAANGQWSRVLTDATPLSEFQMIPNMETQKATPQQSAALDAQSQLIVAQNAANTPAAVAARYQIAYNQFGWQNAGEVPESIQKAAASHDTLRASDGNTYTRGGDGEWTHDGWLRDSKAEGAVRAELNATYRSQQAGLADMAVIAQYAKEHPQPEPDAVREMVAGVYKGAKVDRTEAELDAAAAAVKRDHASAGLGNHSFSLKLLPDPATGTYGPGSPIATFSGDNNKPVEMKSVTTPQEMRAPVNPAPATPAATDQRAAPAATTPTPGANAPDQRTAPAAGPADPAHANHAMLQQIRGGVGQLDRDAGKPYDEASERISRSLLAASRDPQREGPGRVEPALERVDHVVLGKNGNVFAVEGALEDPAHKRAGVAIAEAVRTPVEQSDQKLLAVNGATTEERDRQVAQSRSNETARGQAV